MARRKKYYKALLKEPYMHSIYGEMIYELGKTYKIEEGTELKICENGFHFTDNLYYINAWFDGYDYNIYEVIPGGKVISMKEECNYCSEELTIVKKLTQSEINKAYDNKFKSVIKSNDPFIRSIGAFSKRKKDLDILVRDEDWNVRLIVAHHKIDEYLDILVNDPIQNIRHYIANIGRDKDLDVLVNDVDAYVRYNVARHMRPQDADILKHDEFSFIRSVYEK